MLSMAEAGRAELLRRSFFMLFSIFWWFCFHSSADLEEAKDIQVIVTSFIIYRDQL